MDTPNQQTNTDGPAETLRSGVRLGALDVWLTDAEIEKTKQVVDDSITAEALYILTILRVLAQTTAAHADDLRADEAHLRAEDADGRAEQYLEGYEELLRVFA